MAGLKVVAEETPNPHAMRYGVGRPVSPAGAGATDRPRSFGSAESAAGDALASRLFALPGVVNVMYVRDFVTVNKAPSAKWKALSPKVEAVLREVLG